MSGSRLTQDERRRIALGLSDRLAYAEIARRIGRPTSTVTREILRNGGVAHYRPDLAQRSAQRRAHRSRATAPEVDGGALAPYEQRLVAVLVLSGLTRMPARVLGRLFLTDAGALSAAGLASGLRVSPATVSKAVAVLEALSLVRRERDGRRDRYIVDERLFYESTVAAARANLRFAEIAREGATLLEDRPGAAQRLQDVARFLEIVGGDIVLAADRARTADSQPSA